MTYTITSQCIGCDRCFSACPETAIQKEGTKFWIDPTRCNNCVGHYSVPQCVATCPTNQGCIPGASDVFKQIALANSGDYWERWFNTYDRLITRLHKAKHSAYWEQWFDVYSQKVSTLIQAQAEAGATPLV
jgi:Fe-S-cluster-containing dehydrogenase component